MTPEQSSCDGKGAVLPPAFTGHHPRVNVTWALMASERQAQDTSLRRFTALYFLGSAKKKHRVSIKHEKRLGVSMLDESLCEVLIWPRHE